MQGMEGMQDMQDRLRIKNYEMVSSGIGLPGQGAFDTMHGKGPTGRLLHSIIKAAISNGKKKDGQKT